MKSRYGEIGRFTTDEYQYIVSISKFIPFIDCDDPYIPWFYIHLSKKSSKDRKCGLRHDEETDVKVELLKLVWNLSTIKKLVLIIQEYLDTWKPEYIALTAHIDEFEHRMKFYNNRLLSMGYLEYAKEWYWNRYIYIYKRIC